MSISFTLILGIIIGMITGSAIIGLATCAILLMPLYIICHIYYDEIGRIINKIGKI